MCDSPSSIANDITAVVLAGGASTRMGMPKALLPWRDARFIDHIVAQLQSQAATIAISSNEAASFTSLGLPILADPFPDRRGPLAGMLAGLRFSTTPLTLFVPCDSPAIAPQLATALRSALIETAADVAFARSEGRDHYLFALLRTSLRQSLADRLQHNDYAVYRWFDSLKQVAVPFESCDGHFVNINTPEALHEWQRGGF